MNKTRCAGLARKCSAVMIPLIVLIVFFGMSGNLSAQGQKPPAQPAPTVKPHDPLEGKECSDCHKRVSSPEVNCLLAKKDLCEFCHQVPAEGGPTKLVAAPEPVCSKCHKKDQFKGGFTHGPFAAGACTSCHDPHGGAVPGMLRVTGKRMCMDCHTERAEQFGNARFIHKAAETNCLDCHSPHRSEQPSMLLSAIPGLCGTCHEKTVRDAQMASVRHSPGTKEPACLNCHDPHAAQESRLLLADGADVCLQCHDKPVQADHQEFADIKKLLASNPFPHGPIRNRYCSACHNPHGSPNFRILTDPYPQGFYAPFFTSNYDLCFRCHDSALTTEERTTGATEFRDGDRNLHFVHVNKSSHGRTCRACHEVHASENPKHVASVVPFGNWKLPVKYEKTEDGGSCTPGCHALQKYGRRVAKAGSP